VAINTSRRRTVSTPKTARSSSSVHSGAVLGAAVVMLLVAHEWRESTSRPPFSAPL
jgi:hypothetical protein